MPVSFSIRRRAAERGFSPETTSLDGEDDLLGSKTARIFKAGLDVLRLELRVCRKDDLARFAGSTFFQNQTDGNSGPFETGLPIITSSRAPMNAGNFITPTLAEIRLTLIACCSFRGHKPA